MPAIMSDHNVEGQFLRLIEICLSAEWADLWNELDWDIESFDALDIADNTSDAELWRTCQQEQIVLITGNRNRDGADSLEAAIRAWNTPTSLPVMTIGDPGRVLVDRSYAERVSASLLEYLIDIDNFRGAGRLYLP